MPGADKWLQRLNALIENNLANNQLTNDEIAHKMKVSDRQLFRKVNEFAGHSPKKYLKKYRLKRAMSFLRNGDFRTVNETAFAVGYVNVSYFINQFEMEYGVTPLKVLQAEGWR